MAIPPNHSGAGSSYFAAQMTTPHSDQVFAGVFPQPQQPSAQSAANMPLTFAQELADPSLVYCRQNGASRRLMNLQADPRNPTHILKPFQDAGFSKETEIV